MRVLPDVLRVANGPEFLSEVFTTWCRDHGILIASTQPGKQSQNAFSERFNRTNRNEVMNLYQFLRLDEVREVINTWMEQYN